PGRRAANGEYYAEIVQDRSLRRALIELATRLVQMGFPLPPLLAELYLRIGDGGFGPEYGLLPLLDSPPSGEPAAVVQYLANRESGRRDPDWPWPEGVLPISHWGCAMYACVDCLAPEATVLLFEPNADTSDSAWYVDAPSLETWLRTWVEGTGWYEEANDDMDMAPWPGFRIRTSGTR
ncbi:SMI1/KNR4 family protein, partial [Streptomyces sp. NPDC003832]